MAPRFCRYVDWDWHLVVLSEGLCYVLRSLHDEPIHLDRHNWCRAALHLWAHNLLGIPMSDWFLTSNRRRREPMNQLSHYIYRYVLCGLIPLIIANGLLT